MPRSERNQCGDARNTVIMVRRAFTLVEAMVVIGIVVFLTGLTVTIATSVTAQSEKRSTEQTLQLLDMAFSEWEIESGRKLTWKERTDPPGYQAEVHASTAEILIITEMLDIVQRVPSVESVLGKIDPDMLYQYEDNDMPSWLSPDELTEVRSRFVESLTVLDAWGNPIYATHPGRLRDPTLFPNDQYWSPDPDGTIRTYNEAKYGVARSRRICFVSAGADGQFGYLAAAPDSVDFEATTDNLYSYAPQRPAAGSTPRP